MVQLKEVIRKTEEKPFHGDVIFPPGKARQKNLCKRREAVVKETGANQRISQAGHSPA